MMKKTLSAILLTLAVLLPTSLWAQEPYAVLSEDGLTVTFYYDDQKSIRGGIDINNSNSSYGSSSPYGTATTAVIDVSFAEYKPTSTAYWFQNCSSLTTITGMENLNTQNVTSMCQMFFGCSGLTSLDVSNFNTANVTDMSFMFYLCSDLTSLDVSGFNTSNVTNMFGMFWSCSSLTSLDVTGFNTDNVKYMSDMFYGCSGLTSLDVSHFNTEKVTYMDAMFGGCSGLTSLDVTGFNTDNVKYMSGMFSGCSGLTSLDVSGFNTANVTDMSRMFSGCSGLTSLNLSGFNTQNVTIMHSMFYDCSGLMSLDLSGFNTEKVEGMREMFRLCSSLTSLDVSGFNTANVTDMSRMFSGCSSLTSLDVSGFNTSNVTNMEEMFEDCSSLTSLDLSGFNTDNVTVMIGMFSGCSGLTSLDVSNFNTANVTYMSNMFYGCSGLTSLDVSNFNTANVTYMSFMFSNCSGLTSLDVSGFNTSNVTDMSSMFDGCSSLTSLDVSGFNTANVTDMHQLFYSCEALTSLNVSSFNTSKVTNMWGMFAGCSSLMSLDLSNFDTSNVTEMMQIFSRCYALTSLNVGSFNTTKLNNIHGLFEYCTNLQTIDISSFNTTSVTRMTDTFRGCTSLVTIYAGNEWTTAAVTDSQYMFADSPNLVGGMGTTYDAQHTDHTYAHIDGGPNNPGYFTDKNASEIVAAPTFRFEGDNLFIETATKDASIFYQMADLPNMDEATVEKISESLTVTADAQQSIFYEQPIDLKKSVVLKAIAVGAAVSEVSTLVYDYDGWQKLLAALDYGMDVFGRASNNSNVPDDMKEQLDHMLEEGKWVYYERMWESNAVNNLTNEIMQLAHQMDEMMNAETEPEPYAVLSENNTVLTFYYDGNKADRNGLDIIYTNSWDDQRKGITKAVFDESFANCLTLTSVNWFGGCSKLTTIIGIENLKTDNVTDMSGMFYDCSSLTSLDVSGFKTDNVTTMGVMFMGCSSLSSLDVSHFNTEKLTNMNAMFYGCSGLSSIDLNSLKTDKVTDMSSMFSGCSSLTSLDVSHFNTENVTNMSFMFNGCSKLTDLDVSGFKTDNVTSMNSMFKGCSNLMSLDVSGFKTDNVTSMTSMFYGCKNLANLDVSNFNTANVTDMSTMFYGCKNLTSLDVSNFNTDNVTDMGGMFQSCSSLTSLDVSGFNTNKVTRMSAMFDGCSSLTTIYAGNGWTTNAVTSGPSVFYGCTNLVGGAGTTYNDDHTDYTYAHIDGGPNNPGYFTDKNASELKDGDTFTAVNSDGVELRYMVISAANKTCQVGDKPDDYIISSKDVAAAVDTSYVGIIRIPEEAKGYRVVRVGFEAFFNCSHVTLIEMPNSVSMVTLAAFENSGITEITIPSSVTYFDSHSLGGCKNLESIVVDSQNPVYDSRNGCNAIIRTSSNTLVRGCATTVLTEKDGITTIGIGAFMGCKGQEWSMVLPNTIISIETQAFNSCDLTAITLPSSLQTLGDYVFSGSKILSLVVPASVTTIGEGSFHASKMTSLVVDAGNATFDSRDNCNAVIETATNKLVCGIPTSVIPEGITTIGTYAFDEINNLKSVTLPASITKIEDRAFWCSGLKSITSLIEKPFDISEMTFDTNIYNTCELRVPVGTADVYRSTPYWSSFKNIVEMAPAIEATFDSNGVLAVGSETTMADALEAAGGRAEVAKTITAIVWNSTATLTNDDLQGLDNPNMLIYVQNESQAPKNRDNVVIGDFAKNIVLTDVESGNNNFYCPKEFKAEMISYTHEYRQQTEIGVSRGWETIALPFTVQTIMHEKNGLIAPFGNDTSDKHFWLRQLTQEGLNRATVIEANIPYLISMPNSNEYPAEYNQAGRVTFSAQDTFVPETQTYGMEMHGENGEMIMFLPCFQSQLADEQVYALNVGEQRGSYVEGSVFEANYRAVRPFEAFTVHHGNGPAPQYISVFDMSNGATNIEKVANSQQPIANGMYYDLSGRKLQQKPTRKGVYILNGTKVVIK